MNQQDQNNQSLPHEPLSSEPVSEQKSLSQIYWESQMRMMDIHMKLQRERNRANFFVPFIITSTAAGMFGLMGQMGHMPEMVSIAGILCFIAAILFIVGLFS